VPKLIPKEKSLASVNPELAKQWHPIKNGELTPSRISAGSHKKVWWKCDKGDDHVWEAKVEQRNYGSACPICTGRKVVKSNCLAALEPKLASEWHPSKNGNLTPQDVSSGSNKKVWWQCDKGDDHQWETMVADRSKGMSCPICAGRIVVLSNCLATLNPKLASEWHPSKNSNLTPFDVTVGTGKKVWWKCDKGDDHQWENRVADRSKGKNCPFCSGHKVARSNCLKITNPALALEWHPTKNGILTPQDVSSGSNKKVWWQCDKGDDHQWETRVADRSKGNNCPVCAGQIVVKSSSLAILNPLIASQWHPTKNGTHTPFDFSIGSGKNIWWKCDKGDDHIWKSEIRNRIHGNNCPICSGRKVVGSNNLTITHPELCNQWHPTRNGELIPLNVSFGMNKKVWWKCDKVDDHEWKTTINNRSRDRNCPYCTLTPQSRQELIITHELITIFKDIDPKGFKISTDGKLRSMDIYIPELKLGIEFDGAYWHKGKRELDKLKTEELESVGLNIIRVRQKPLKRIFDSDVMAEKKYDGKAITNGVLQQILKDYKLDKRTLNKIHNYILKPDLQNEKGLDAYIDMILTEKAERNQLST
jgi:hypothetical protein